jgi:hypothetical protein
MAELIITGTGSTFDLSPYLEEEGYTVRKVNIYDDYEYSDARGNAARPIIGHRYEADVKLSAVPEEVIANLNAAMTAAAFDVSFTFPDSSLSGENVNVRVSRPDITVTAVHQYSDGVYWDESVKLVSEDYYSDDCL